MKSVFSVDLREKSCQYFICSQDKAESISRLRKQIIRPSIAQNAFTFTLFHGRILLKDYEAGFFIFWVCQTFLSLSTIDKKKSTKNKPQHHQNYT